MSEESEILVEEIELDEEILNQLNDLVGQKEVWTNNDLQYYGPSTRSIILVGEVNENSASVICSQIQELNVRDTKEPIYLYINTPGGNIVDALAIFDMLRCVENPIITVVTGGCFSAGLLIASAGDHRLATPNSMYFYHQPTMEMIGINSLATMESASKFYEWCRQNTEELIRTRIGMSEENWNKDFGPGHDKYFTAQQAVEYGFCTGLIQHTTKPEISLKELELE